MATKGNTALNEGIPEIEDAFIVIVRTEWNAHIVNELELGAKNILQELKINFIVITVPGAIEIPFAIKKYASANQQVADAFIAIGTVIRGDTPHFDYVCKFITDGILHLNMLLDVPVIFGVLTVNDEQQAWESVGGEHG